MDRADNRRAGIEDAVPRPLDHILSFGAPDAPALLLREARHSYRELESLTGRWATWLQAEVDVGGRVACWTAKGLVSCILPLACARAGLVYVPVNPLLKPAQVAHICADCSPALLVGSASRLATLGEGDLPASTQTMIEDEFSSCGIPDETLPPSTWDTDDLAALLYTSGSTGKPKGVMLSHANLWLGAVSVAAYLEMRSDDVTLAVLPLSFDYGQNQLYSTWLAGGSVAPLDYLFAKDVVKACGRYAVTTLAGVPPLWMQLMDAEWPGEIANALRRVTNSGGALTPALIGRMRGTFPNADIYPMYGLTEAFRSTYLSPDKVADFPTSIGTAIPFAEIMLVDGDGHVVEGEGEGELVHCGPLVAKGYWRDEMRSRERFRPTPPGSRHGGTAVWSGDRVRRDENGLLYFAGRNDAMIKTSGNRVSPEEIEDAAREAGAPDAVVAIGVPDERLGQAIALLIETDGPLDIEELRTRMARSLPNFMVPAQIRVFDQLPRTPNGKFDRVALAQEFGAPR